MIVYEDQDGRHRLSEAEAIVIAKLVAKAKGREYPNDRVALEDFIVIHWAWEEK